MPTLHMPAFLPRATPHVAFTDTVRLLSTSAAAPLRELHGQMTRGVPVPCEEEERQRQQQRHQYGWL